MNRFLCLLALGLCLCVLPQVNAKKHFRKVTILSALKEAKKIVDDAYLYSRTESLRRVARNTAHPADILRLMKQPSRDTRSAVRSADYMENTLQLLQERAHRIHKRSLNATDLISEEDLETIAKLTGCSARARSPSCQTTQHLNRFRTATSVCNNRVNSRRGSSNNPFIRWLPAEYQDSISLPKGWDPYLQHNNHMLPLVRLVSNRIMSMRNEDVVNDTLYTHFVTIFGQWTDHDLTFTPHTPSIRSFNSGINCDKSCERTEPCFPINVPKNDTRKSDECIPFFRSAPACGTGNTGFFFGAINVREQMNSLTAFIDCGQVYGSDDGLARELRNLTNDRGLLRVNTRYTDNGRELLPFSTMPVNMCANRKRITSDNNAKDVPCFQAGDERANENIGLSSIHTLMLREHNRLARALGAMNPQWTGETIYQEARKIMGAYFQRITFRDYLFHIVGPDFVERQLGDYPGYDENVDPSISNVFATAAYRFAHLSVQPFMFRLNENYEEHPQFPSPILHTAFFTPWRLVFEGGLDPVLRGLAGRPAKLNTQDTMMNEELRERLFEFLGDLALDLAALNLQRGRDHGLPGYNKWRQFCGLSQPQNLAELAEVMNNTVLAERLLELYGTPGNIDVWLAGVAEPFVPGGRVGPLFACLIATQFQRIRQGDRLWWENDGVFTSEQRNSIKETSLARIICDNTGITEVPPSPFLFRPRGSGYTSCEDIPAFDLSPWKDNGAGWNDGGEYGERGPPGPQGPPGPAGPPGNASLAQRAAFAVRLGYNFPHPGQPIAFKEVIYNGQHLYNTQSGVFTCQEPGVYQFDFTCTLYQNTGNVDLRHNNELVLHSFTTQQNGYVTATGGTILQLAHGDTVFLTANYGGNGLTADSFFSGHILFTI